MRKYKITITEILQQELTISANSPFEAVQKAEGLYNEEKVVLLAGDFRNSEIDLSEFSGLADNIEFLNFVLASAEKSIAELSAEELAVIAFGSKLSAIEAFQRAG